MKTRKTVMLAGGFAGFVALAAGIALLSSSRSAADAEQTTVRPVAVEVTAAALDTVVERVAAVGTVNAMKDVTVSSETAGRVLEVRVNVGDRVRAGQTLVVVDHELREIAVEQARVQVLAAETNFGKTKRDFERTQTLFASGDVSDAELESYRLAYRSAEAAHASAKAGLRQAERQLDDTRIKSPIDGIVAERMVEQGEMLAPGAKVANIIDIANVKVALSVPEEDIIRIRADQPAAVAIDGQGGAVIEGTVYTVGSKTVTPTGHTYPVEVLVRNTQDLRLKAGMFARVEIITGRANGVLTVSTESLVEDGGSPTIFVVDGGIARLRHLTLGKRSTDRVEVRDGLKPGELVVSFGQKSLQDGAPVRYR